MEACNTPAILVTPPQELSDEHRASLIAAIKKLDLEVIPWLNTRDILTRRLSETKTELDKLYQERKELLDSMAQNPELCFRQRKNRRSGINNKIRKPAELYDKLYRERENARVTITSFLDAIQANEDELDGKTEIIHLGKAPPVLTPPSSRRNSDSLNTTYHSHGVSDVASSPAALHYDEPGSKSKAKPKLNFSLDSSGEETLVNPPDVKALWQGICRDKELAHGGRVAIPKVKTAQILGRRPSLSLGNVYHIKSARCKCTDCLLKLLDEA